MSSFRLQAATCIISAIAVLIPGCTGGDENQDTGDVS
jgi:hypothetical protein